MVAFRLDSGEPGLQTEGAIAKLFATEVGNTAAEAAIQAHGGYGYTHEYFVEKIKRDVRITTIYEGTSEILQNIIYMCRSQQHRESGNGFFSDAAADVRQLGPEVGASIATHSAEALGARLAFRQLETSSEQHLMFELADRIAEVEHALAFCRRASQLGHSHQAACRLFAAEVASRMAASIIRIVTASHAPRACSQRLLEDRRLRSVDLVLA